MAPDTMDIKYVGAQTGRHTGEYRSKTLDLPETERIREFMTKMVTEAEDRLHQHYARLAEEVQLTVEWYIQEIYSLRSTVEELEIDLMMAEGSFGPTDNHIHPIRRGNY